MSELQLELLVLCDLALVSQENKLSIVGVFDHIYTQATPAHHPKMSVVGVLKGQPDTNYQVLLSFKDPSGNEVVATQTLTATTGPNGKTNLITDFMNLPLPVPGIYIFEVLVDGKVLGTRELGVLLIGDQTNANNSKEKVIN